MNIETLADWQLQDVQRRVRRNEGQVISVKTTEWVTQRAEDGTVVLDEATGEPVEVAVPGQRDFFVGRLNPDNTVPVLGALGMVFFGATQDAAKARAAAQAAADKAEELGTDFEITEVIRYIGGKQLVNLVAAILEEDPAWVRENWDVASYIRALGVFFKANRFFDVFQESMELIQSLGLTGDTAA